MYRYRSLSSRCTRCSNTLSTYFIAFILQLEFHRSIGFSLYHPIRQIVSKTAVTTVAAATTAKATTTTTMGWKGRIVARILEGEEDETSPMYSLRPPDVSSKTTSLGSDPSTGRTKNDNKDIGNHVDDNEVIVELNVHVWSSEDYPLLEGGGGEEEEILPPLATFRFTRKASEPVTACLKRMSLNLSKKLPRKPTPSSSSIQENPTSDKNDNNDKKKKNKDKRSKGDERGRAGESIGPIYRATLGTTTNEDISDNDKADSETVIDAEQLNNLEFWRMGISRPLSLQMTVHDVDIAFQTEVNPPTIKAVSTFEMFDSYIFPGVPLHIHVDTLFATEAMVDWYADGEPLCRNSPLYIPTIEDANKKLMVRITPIRPDHNGHGCQQEYPFQKSVSSSRPTNTVLDIRSSWQQSTSPRRTTSDVQIDSGGGTPLRIMSFNILADQNAFSGPDRTCFFPWVSAEIMDRSRRMPLILHEILEYQADVICLQEVDQLVFDTLLEPILRQYQYQGFFSVKQSPGQQEGCAMFWSLQTFHPVSHQDDAMKTYSIGELFGKYDASSSLLEDMSDWKECAQVVTELLTRRPDLKEIIRTKLGHILQVARLRRLGDDAPLIVSNTHLFFHPEADHIRLLQLFAIAHQLDRERSTIVSSSSDQQEQKMTTSVAPFVLCGDFNTSLTNCALLLMNGHVPKNYRDYRRCLNSFNWNAFRTKTESDTTATTTTTTTMQETTRVHDDDFPEINLPKSFPCLETAYPHTPVFTNFIVNFSATLDHILMSTNGGELIWLRQAEMPTLEQVTKDIAMPSPSFPSDHIAIVTDLRWTTTTASSSSPPSPQP